MKYGDVFQFNLIGKTFVSLNSAEVLRDTFMKEPNATITAGRPASHFGRHLLDNYSDLISSSTSKKWTKRRKFTYQLLHSYGKGLQDIEKIIQQNLRLLKGELIAFDEKDQDPSNFIDEFILNSVEILLIGRAFGKDGDFQPLIRMSDELLNTLVNPAWDLLYSKFPILRSLSLQKSREMNEFIKTKKQLLDLLNKYTLIGRTLGKCGDLQPLMRKAEYLANMIAIPGWDFLYLTFPFLRKIPLQKSREIDEFLKIKQQILDLLNKYTIIPNLWTIHHSTKDWGDPFNFRPERFLDNTGNLLPATAPERKRLLAFGLGKRSCIGEVFAKFRMFLFLATLMQTVNIHEPNSEKLPDLIPNDMVPGITLQPRPYKVKFVLR